MHRTTLLLSEDLFRQARSKATSEGVSLSEVLRGLLDRWVTGELRLPEPEGSRASAAERAAGTFGMWKDRDPDELLRESRAGLEDRDRELEDARRLASR